MTVGEAGAWGKQGDTKTLTVRSTRKACPGGQGRKGIQEEASIAGGGGKDKEARTWKVQVGKNGPTHEEATFERGRRIQASTQQRGTGS